MSFPTCGNLQNSMIFPCAPHQSSRVHPQSNRRKKRYCSFAINFSRGYYYPRFVGVIRVNLWHRPSGKPRLLTQAVFPCDPALYCCSNIQMLRHIPNIPGWNDDRDVEQFVLMWRLEPIFLKSEKLEKLCFAKAEGFPVSGLPSFCGWRGITP